MKETVNDEIGIAAYDADGKAEERVQITLVNQPQRTIYMARNEALLLAERIRRKAESLPAPKTVEVYNDPIRPRK